MDQKLINNNDRFMEVDGRNGTRVFKLMRIVSMDDLSFLTTGQSLALKVNVDDQAEMKHLSTYPLGDDEGKIAVINQTFAHFNFLQLEIIADNELLSADQNFNLALDYDLI